MHRSIGISAKNDKRRNHKRSVSTLGGLGILAALIFGTITQNSSFSASFSIAAFVLCAIVGVADDTFELRARWKFLGHNLITGLLMTAIRDFESPVDAWLGDGSLGSFLLEWFWCLGLLNSINLIDGLDGLASGTSLLVLSAITLLNPSGHWATYIAIPAILGFYICNRHPAKIFMGESGSLAVASAIFLACMTTTSIHNPSPTTLVSGLLVLLVVPIVDTSLAIIRRIKRGTGLMVADREHLHHRLLRIGLKHDHSVIFLHGISAYLAFTGVRFIQETAFQTAELVLALIGLNIALAVLYFSERKLYFYIAGFSGQVLKILDSTHAINAQIRLQTLLRDNDAFVAHRLQLEACVHNLLEHSPGQIQQFYTHLAKSVQAAAGNWEIHFESSTAAIIIERLSNNDEVTSSISRLRVTLEKFEEKEKIDLGLAHKKSIVTIAIHSAINPSIERSTQTIQKKKAAA